MKLLCNAFFNHVGEGELEHGSHVCCLDIIVKALNTVSFILPGSGFRATT